MMPGGMNPSSMKKQLQRMGVRSEEIDAVEVLIRGRDKAYRIRDPAVMRMVVQGQETYQIVGTAEEIAVEAAHASAEGGGGGSGSSFSEDDIELVMSQAKVAREAAVGALQESDGAPAEAIVALMAKRK